MVKKLPELSIFFPFWNEGKNIENVVTSAVAVAEKVADQWEIVMVDDGSSDDTLEKAQKLAQKNKNLKVVSHSPNRGYGAALKEGFLNSKYRYIVFTDGDRQFDFQEVTKFIEKIDNADIVIGYRRERKDHPVRHLLMNLLKIWDYIFFRFYFKDIDCAFKMFKKEAVERIMPLRSEGAMITTEILAKAKNKNLKIEQVEVSHYPRKYGDQSGANIFVIVRAILESLTLWLDIKNARI
ncbi:glycosyltransferase family 2 protein [Candidatus Parcubacteria bacterium]|nr:MAG: glycosyltransferase family 2 protein [Candidatus Parcubacteria bacterium]